LVGGATFNIGDSAQLDVDGDLTLTNNAQFNATGTSQTFICGNRPAANTAGVSVTVFCGDLGDGATNCASYEGCRILPVDFAGFDAKFNGQVTMQSILPGQLPRNGTTAILKSKGLSVAWLISKKSEK
jgi:hypothetical protein